MKKYTKQEWAYTTIGLALGVAVALSLGQGNYMAQATTIKGPVTSTLGNWALFLSSNT